MSTLGRCIWGQQAAPLRLFPPAQDMHRLAESKILAGLKAMGLVTGDVAEMVQQRIGALFMPHGAPLHVSGVMLAVLACSLLCHRWMCMQAPGQVPGL